MSEKRQITTLMAITLVIGVVALILALALPPALEGNLVVDRYEAAISADGTLTEHYTYVVKTPGTYRMLFRTWEVPLAGSALTQPSVEVVGMQAPPGTIGYYRDYQGQVTIYGMTTDQARATIRSLVQDNEIGFYDPGYFPAGTYDVYYTFRLHPPLEYDTRWSHLNLRLADQHIPYHSVQVTFPSGGVASVYPYPPFLSVRESGGITTVSGSAGENEVLGVEIVAARDYLVDWDGFPGSVADVQGLAESGFFWYSLPYYAGALLLAIAGILVLIMPVLLYLIWNRFGREKEFVVPEYLSFVPDRTLLPWVVNLVFKDEALTFDENGFYATVLDLARRKFLEIKPKGEAAGSGITIKVLQGTSPDPYEQRVLNFLRNLADGGVVDTDALKGLPAAARTDRSAELRAMKIQSTLQGITTQVDTTVANRYVIDGRPHLAPLLLGSAIIAGLSILILILGSQAGTLLLPAAVLGSVAVIQVAIGWAFPSTLFGQWKGDIYQEKLQWDAFRAFLSDLARIKEYAPQDLSMWGEWLVFGTA
ncbi:MAG TPA: DUF2207 domain-containing protein, partial [Methanomicrobiales archaeon]|nr:DUF2207 domain-containing protein [Methanomicrobiales archaeon]